MRVHIDDGYAGPVCGEVVMPCDRVEEYRDAVQFNTCCPPCVEVYHELLQHANEDQYRTYPHSDGDAFMEVRRQ